MIKVNFNEPQTLFDFNFIPMIKYEAMFVFCSGIKVLKTRNDEFMSFCSSVCGENREDILVIRKVKNSKYNNIKSIEHVKPTDL